MYKNIINQTPIKRIDIIQEPIWCIFQISRDNYLIQWIDYHISYQRNWWIIEFNELTNCFWSFHTSDKAVFTINNKNNEN